MFLSLLVLVLQMHLVVSLSDQPDFLSDSLQILRVRLTHSDSALAGQKNLRCSTVVEEEEVPDVLTELVVVNIGSQCGPRLTVEDQTLVIDGT